MTAVQFGTYSLVLWIVFLGFIISTSIRLALRTEEGKKEVEEIAYLLKSLFKRTRIYWKGKEITDDHELAELMFRYPLLEDWIKEKRRVPDSLKNDLIIKKEVSLIKVLAVFLILFGFCSIFYILGVILSPFGRILVFSLEVSVVLLLTIAFVYSILGLDTKEA